MRAPATTVRGARLGAISGGRSGVSYTATITSRGARSYPQSMTLTHSYHTISYRE